VVFLCLLPLLLLLRRGRAAGGPAAAH